MTDNSIEPMSYTQQIIQMTKKIFETYVKSNFLLFEQEQLRVLKLLSETKLMPIIELSTKIDCFHYQRLTNLYPYHENEFQGLIKIIPDDKEYLIDIRHIDAVSASKSLSWGLSFENLFSWGKFLIQEIELHKQNTSYEDYQKCMGCVINCKDYIFSIKHSLWENTLFWSNSGNSHHFAAAIFHASSEKELRKIKITITKEEIDTVIANNLLEKYDIFIAHKNLFDLLHKIDRNMDYKKYNNVFMFAKNNLKTEQIRSFFKLCDKDYIFYFNDYLKNCIERQNTIAQNQQTMILKATKNSNEIIYPIENKNVCKLNFLEPCNR